MANQARGRPYPENDKYNNYEALEAEVVTPASRQNGPLHRYRSKEEAIENTRPSDAKSKRRILVDDPSLLYMPNVPEPDPIPPKDHSGPPRRLCMKCHKSKIHDEFYHNKLWEAQQRRDVWCKTCAHDLCVNEDTLREYCYYNNRMYSPEYFKESRVKAMYALNSNKEFVSPRTERSRKEEMLDKEACMQFFKVMNADAYYSYYDNVREDMPLPVFSLTSESGMILPEPTQNEDDVLTYSPEWFGRYTVGDIKYLDSYLKNLQESFDLSDPSRLDYAKKMCRASLEADKKFNAYKDGTGDLADWQKAVSVYDMLNKSAAFAASSKKKDSLAVNDIQSLSEFILAVESTGKLLVASPEYFPDDNVDKVYRQFKHAMRAIKGDST